METLIKSHKDDSRGLVLGRHCIVYKDGERCKLPVFATIPGIGYVCRYHGRNYKEYANDRQD